jgi:hypothetical protein
VRVLADRSHPEHESFFESIGGAFDPDSFDAAAVIFDDPGKRWEQALRS